MSTHPKTIHVWQKRFGTTEPQLVEVPVPSAPPDGLLIKVHAAGVCHSDVALLNAPSKPPEARWPYDSYTLGHEGCGEIVAIGDKVTGWNVGDMVVIDAVAGCGADDCSECTRGLQQICQRGEAYGIGYHGSYAPYIAIKARAAAKLPDGVAPEVGAVATDACMTAYHAVVGTGRVTEGQVVVVIGIGGLGFNALQIVLALGARCIVVDQRKDVLEEAVKFGIREADVVPVEEGLVQFAKRHGLVVDTVIDFVGVQETFDAAQEAGEISFYYCQSTMLTFTVRFGGTLVQVGLLSPHIAINNFLSVRKHLSILCSYGGTMEDLKQCLRLIADGKLRPQVVIGKLEDLPKVLEDLHAGKVKSRIALVP